MNTHFRFRVEIEQEAIKAELLKFIWTQKDEIAEVVKAELERMDIMAALREAVRDELQRMLRSVSHSVAEQACERMRGQLQSTVSREVFTWMERMREHDDKG